MPAWFYTTFTPQHRRYLPLQYAASIDYTDPTTAFKFVHLLPLPAAARYLVNWDVTPCALYCAARAFAAVRVLFVQFRTPYIWFYYAIRRSPHRCSRTTAAHAAGYNALRPAAVACHCGSVLWRYAFPVPYVQCSAPFAFPARTHYCRHALLRRIWRRALLRCCRYLRSAATTCRRLAVPYHCALYRLHCITARTATHVIHCCHCAPVPYVPFRSVHTVLMRLCHTAAACYYLLLPLCLFLVPSDPTLRRHHHLCRRVPVTHRVQFIHCLYVSSFLFC